MEWNKLSVVQPPKDGMYLCSVATDNGAEVHTLEFEGKYFLWDQEPTFCRSDYFDPKYWAEVPKAHPQTMEE